LHQKFDIRLFRYGRRPRSGQPAGIVGFRQPLHRGDPDGVLVHPPIGEQGGIASRKISVKNL
jgi:hypothetical protein